MNRRNFHCFLHKATAIFLASLMALPAPSLVGIALVCLSAIRADANPGALSRELPTEPTVFEAPPPRRSPPSSANRQGVYQPPQSSSRKDIFQSRLFAEALTTGGPESWQDRQRVAEFVRWQHADQAAIGSTEDLTGRLKSFLADHPDSPYTGSLLVNLAENYYQSGYFSKALDAWKSAWENLRQAEAGPAKALADQAFGQYLLMLARIGRLEEMESLLSEQRHRPWSGASSELIAGAKESIWNMKNRPGLSFRCGPFALANSYLELGYPAEEGSPLDILRQARSTDRGVSLLQLQELAAAAGMKYVAVKKAPEAPFDDSLFPLVAHWKLDHYGAVLGRVDARYTIKDPTFLDRFEVSAAALNDQSSGYFLAPDGSLPSGWKRVSHEEAAGVWGRGAPPQKDSDDDSEKMGGEDPCDEAEGMPMYSFSPVLVGLALTDTPLSYHTPYGPAMRFTLHYSQRDSHQPANFTYANLGHKWNLNWIGFVKDDSLNASADVEFYLDGVNQTFTDYDSETGSFGRHRRNRAKLVRISADPITYELRYPNGSRLRFAESDGVIGAGRKVFLTKKIDGQGNEVALQYDARMRLAAVTDVLGQVSTFSYRLYRDDLKITRMTDPFGRSATLNYDGAGRLVGVTDQGGLTSSFDYDSGYFIQAMTTPYGTTTFVYGENGAERWIEATDPYGDRERLEFRNHDVVNDDRNFPIADSESDAPSNFSSPNIRNRYLSERNTFHWDKEAMHEAEANGYIWADKKFYALADITHWLHKDVLHGVVTTIPESIKKPLENRVWFTYQGQTHASVAGAQMMTRPKQAGRALDDGSNQTLRFTFNDLGLVTNSIDPKSRNFSNVYADNDIDLLEMRQTYGSNNELLASYTYNDQHLPLTFTDAAGQTTTFSYNGRGQPTLLTDALGDQTRYTYDRDLDGTADADGYPIQVEQTDPSDATGFVTLEQYTYYSTGNLATSTDADGYTLGYTYDSFDRLTSITYPDGTRQVLIYDRLDLAAQKDRENRWTRHWHDALGRLTATIDAMSSLTQMEWCRCGDLSRLIDANGNSTRWVRDLQGRVTEKIYPDGSSYHFNYYDSISWLKTRTDALDQVTTYAYQKDGNLSAVSYTDTVNPTAGVTFKYAQTYDRITEMRDGIGTTKYYYHPIDGTTLGAGQLREVNGAFRADLIKFDYDELGRVKTRKVNNVETDYRFDSLARLTGTTNPLGEFSLNYYGPTGRVRDVQYPNGQQVAYNYYGPPGDFRLRSLYNADASGANLSRFGYKYSPQGNITGWSKRLGNSGDQLLELSYDRVDRLIGARDIVPFTSRVTREYGYVYDGVGNRTAERVDGVVTGATYNELNQLTASVAGGPMRFSGTTDEPAQVTVEEETATPSDGGRAFERNLDFTAGSHTVEITATDASGNTSSRDYLLSTTAADSKTYTYDANGNLTSDRVRTFFWDADGAREREDGAPGSGVSGAKQRVSKAGAPGATDEQNRLISIIEGSKKSKFSYDGLGRRVRIRELDRGTETSNRTFVWSGTAIVEERNAAGTQASKRYYARGLVDRTGSEDKKYYYTFDHLGSTREVVEDDGVTVAARYDYDPFGRVEKLGGSYDVDFLYTGHLHHLPSGLYLTHYRAYDPDTGVWLSRDPQDYIDGPNPYAYVLNNPINSIDPTGEALLLIIFVVFEIGSTAYDVYYMLTTVLDDCASEEEKANAVAGAAMGLGLPGGGYGRILNVSKTTPKPRTNKVQPVEGAGPHTGFKRDPQTGKVTGYTEYDASGNAVKRFRGTGRPHGGQDPPLILEPKPGKGPGSPPKVPRPPRPDELPLGY